MLPHSAGLTGNFQTKGRPYRDRKNFQIIERVGAEFRAEVANLTNTIRWSNPNAGSASMQLNADGSLRNANNFMSVTGTPSGYERQSRFGLRVSF